MTPAPSTTSAAPRTLGGLCELLAELDLFSSAAPVRESSRHYRRWAYESAALDLALRQSGASLHEALGRDPKPVTFVCSTRLSSFGDEDSRSTTEPVRRRLDKYPTLRFKLDPENDWDAELIAELAEIAGVDVLDLKGHYRGTPVDVETDPELYRAVAEAFPSAYLEDPDLNDETRPVLEPHADRVTWDAPLHSLADIEALEREPRAINSKPSRFGSLERAVRRLRALRAARASRSTAAARASSAPGEARSSTWPRSFTPTPRTTSLPRATTTRRSPTGCPPARSNRRPRRPAFAGASGRTARPRRPSFARRRG